AQAVQLAVFFLLPSIMLSGFIFPREGMPPFLQDLGNLIPLTYFLHIVRGIMLKGVGLDILWPQAVPLTVVGVAIFLIAVNRFQKRLV
ncbi:MAG: ABC transporter permease, partial [Dehalococcoidia bacterium]|nr:ABC transporter permease [Dehalococcoidia bacterium]